MSVRLSGATQSGITGYTRTLSSGTQTAMTMCCWINLPTLTSWYTGLIGVAATTTGSDFNGLTIGRSSLSGADAGRDLRLDSPSMTWTASNALLVPLNTWCFVGVAIAGTNFSLYASPVDTPTMAVFTGTGADTSVNALTQSIGFSTYNDSPLNGDITGAKLWLGVRLTDAEMAQEARQLMPYRRANLRSVHPLTSPANLADYSGNNLTLTAGTASVTDSDGPGVPWIAERSRFPGPSPALVRASTW